MKKISFLLLLLFACSTLSAKKVKFAVDMTGSTPSPNGVHVSGDFQSEAGFPGGDWLPGTTLLTLEPGTEIYSIVVDIPAFTKYEYIFVNGDQSYEWEFVPPKSRANYNFSDYRWLYVDSTANDTTFPGAVVFATNAPLGLALLRFKVNMTGQVIPPSGVHVAGDFQGWDPGAIRMYSFNDTVYEHISYVQPGTHAYRFVNGNTASEYEAVYGGCALNYGRTVTMLYDLADTTYDTVLDPVNFSSCLIGVEETSKQDFQVYPNPSSGFFFIRFSESIDARIDVLISDITGRLVQAWSGSSQGEIKMPTGGMHAGIYHVSIRNENGLTSHSNIMVE